MFQNTSPTPTYSSHPSTTITITSHSSDMPSDENGRREVLDPITNLPLTVHDVTDLELEKLPPSLSTVEERHRAPTQEYCPQQCENGLILDRVEWWSNSDSYLDHLRIQTALVAGVTAGFGAILVLFSWWLLKCLSSRQIFHLADLFILVTDCCLFGIGVGVATVLFPLPSSVQIDSIVCLSFVITTLPLIRYHLHPSIHHVHTSKKQVLVVIPLNGLILSSVQSGR